MSKYCCKRGFFLVAGLLLTLAFLGCRDKPSAPQATSAPTAAPVVIASANTPAPTAAPTASPTPVPEQLQYVFLFIGDGMGPNQVTAVNEALAAQGLPPLGFTEKFPVRGEAITNNIYGEITDSAAAATAIATGRKTENKVLGQDGDGKRRSTIGETLKKQNWGVGILTTVSLDNATPAGFYAHTDKRSNYEAIIEALFDSGFDYFAGGGFHGKKDRTPAAQKAGYQITSDEGEAAASVAEQGVILVGPRLMGDKGLPLAVETEDGRAGQLARYTAVGIDRLVEKGPFFMMVEGGRIDLAGHYHDPGDLYRETLDFDLAVAEAVQFYYEHPAQTLVLVTADHETGGLELESGDRSRLAGQTMSCDRFDETCTQTFIAEKPAFAQALPVVVQAFGLHDLTQEETAALETAYGHTLANDLDEEALDDLYGVYSPIASAAAGLVSARAGLLFTSGNHTGVNVPVYALGVGDETFAGVYENTAIYHKIFELIQRYGG